MNPQDSIALDRLSADGRPSPADSAAVLEQIRSGEIDTVIVGGCDLGGVFRAKRVPAERFASMEEPLIEFSEYMWAMDIDDYAQPTPDGIEGWPDWKTGFGDIEAVADLGTLRRVPWLERTAIVLCSYRYGKDREYEVSPRNVLQRVIARYESLGLEPRLAPELEFIVLRETEQSAIDKGFRDLTPLSPRPMAYGAMQGTLDNHLIGPVVAGLQQMRVPVEAWNPEGASGQYELNLPHAQALDAADIGFLFKHGVKEMCALSGLTATFMSKPFSADFGSSLHVHQSVWRDGEPAFHDPAGEHGMSALLLNYVAGQVETLVPFAPIWLPNPPAFKRGGAYTAAGTTVTWGGDNKTLSLRVLSHEGKTCRIEHRVCGADANIYLALAGMLAGGLYGIENELQPPAPTTGDAYADTSVGRLPASLEESLPAFEQNEAANEYFGEEFVRRYAATRRWEVEQSRREITDWELRRYLVRS